MTTYITQEQAVALSKTIDWTFHPFHATELCNAAIQHHRDSLMAGVVLPEPDGSTTVLEGPLLHEGREIGEITNEVDAWSEPLVRQAIADALAKQVTRAPIAETAHNIKGQHMSKLEEMWAALTAYQPQADAAGHGESWAAMCKERTVAAARAAYYAADAYWWAQQAIERINKVLAAQPAQPLTKEQVAKLLTALASVMNKNAAIYEAIEIMKGVRG
jgi:hypothetical protein